MSEKSTKIMPQYIIPLSMLYIVSFVFPIMLTYRMVQLDDFLLPGKTIFFASSCFFINDFK